MSISQRVYGTSDGYSLKWYQSLTKNEKDRLAREDKIYDTAVFTLKSVVVGACVGLVRYLSVFDVPDGILAARSFEGRPNIMYHAVIAGAIGLAIGLTCFSGKPKLDTEH